MEEKTTEAIFGLTDEDYVRRAATLFEQTLRGLGSELGYKIDISREVNCTEAAEYFGASKYTVAVRLLPLPEGVAEILDRDFATVRDAVKGLALCACQFALRFVDSELSTPPEERGLMSAPPAYWYKLRDEVNEFKETHLNNE
jgi:hypothetical protein